MRHGARSPWNYIISFNVPISARGQSTKVQRTVQQTAGRSTALYLLSWGSALQPALRLRYTDYELIIIIIWILVAMLGMRVKYTIYIEIVKSDWDHPICWTAPTNECLFVSSQMPKCSIIQNVECARNAELRQSSSQWSEEYSSAKCFIDFVVLLYCEIRLQFVNCCTSCQFFCHLGIWFLAFVNIAARSRAAAATRGFCFHEHLLSDEVQTDEWQTSENT